MPADTYTIQRRGRPTTVGQGKPSRTGKALALPLTERQERFILAWLVRRNSTRAYQDSYPGASYETCRVEGSRLFRDPRISCHIRALLQEEAKRLESKAQRVTDALAAMAFTPISAAFDASGELLPVHQLPAGVAIAMKKYKRKPIIGAKGRVIGHDVDVELHDKVTPLRMLGVELGMFTERVEHTADAELLEAMQRGRARALARAREPQIIDQGPADE